jgi:hypothetical protein
MGFSEGTADIEFNGADEAKKAVDEYNGKVVVCNR